MPDEDSGRDGVSHPNARDGDLASGKQLYRLGRQDGRAAAQHTFGEARNVSGGSEEACVRGHAAHHVRVLVVDLALDNAPAPGAVVFRRWDFPSLIRQRIEPGACHAQRREDLLSGKDIERRVRFGREQFPEQNEADVAVLGTCAGERR